jgi:hypothetical protein
MSAERDQQQGTKFIYSNFYQLYRQGKLQAETAKEDLIKGKVLRAHTTEAPIPAEVQVIHSKTSADWSKWASPRSDVRDHLKQLREIRQRLKFLSDELDEVLKRS